MCEVLPILTKRFEVLLRPVVIRLHRMNAAACAIAGGKAKSVPFFRIRREPHQN